MLLNMDLSKAYGRLSWAYLLVVLKAFGFAKDWISWIVSMISTPLFSIPLNGSPTDTFHSSRGLKQGDPISPFLFILFAQGLSRLITKPKSNNKLKEILLLGMDISMNDQQFVNDNLLYGEPTVWEALAIDKILAKFQAASGMILYKEKSNIYFFHTPRHMQIFLAHILGFSIDSLPSKYLGVPLLANPLYFMLERHKHQAYEKIIQLDF